MAGDWIKMRCELQTHPKIVRILSAIRPHDVQTRTDKFRVIGGLHAVWSVFDAHSDDGSLFGYTPETMDHVIGWDGFSQALIDVEWLLYDGMQTIVLPEFLTHNGKSGKRRAEDQKRKRDDRKSPQSVRNLSASEADKMRTREEKRREDINTPKPPPGGLCKFEEFWTAWPKSERKHDKVKCAKKWRDGGLDDVAEQILADIEVKRQTEKWRGGFIEAPLVYLNGRRWEDGAEPESANQVSMWAGAV